MPIGLAVTAGLLVVADLAIFVLVMFRLAGIQPTPLERRRWAVNFVVFFVLAMILAVVAALVGQPGGWLFGLGLAIAAYFGARKLQQNGHWLVTPTAEERALLPARREAIATLKRRPAFWLLVAGFVFFVPIFSIALVLAFR